MDALKTAHEALNSAMEALDRACDDPTLTLPVTYLIVELNNVRLSLGLIERNRF